MSRITKRTSRGFTLMEVMIVVAIVGILAAIVFPNYQEHVLRGNRAEGQALLTTAAARQERYRAQNNNYARSVAELYGGAKASETGKYDLGVNGDGTDYTLTATPTFSDADCGNFTLDEKGERGVAGSKGKDHCWR